MCTHCCHNYTLHLVSSALQCRPHCALCTCNLWWQGVDKLRRWHRGHRSQVSPMVALTPVKVYWGLQAMVVTRPGWQCGPYWHTAEGTQNTEQQDPASRERWQRCTSTQPRYYRWSSTLQHQHQPLLEQADTVLGSLHKYLPNFLISQV